MKKKICIVSIVIALVCVLTCLAACGNNSEILNSMNDAIKQDSYTHVTVDVTSEKDDITLNGTYNITFYNNTATVEYSFDKLNELSIDGNNQDEYISRVTGTVTVVDGHVADGDTSEDLNVGELAYTGFSFKQNFFANVKSSKSTFRADVTNPKGFVGNNEFVCTDMYVEVVLSGKLLSKLSLTYVSANGFDTKVTYLFSA